MTDILKNAERILDFTRGGGPWTTRMVEIQKLAGEIVDAQQRVAEHVDPHKFTYADSVFDAKLHALSVLRHLSEKDRQEVLAQFERQQPEAEPDGPTSAERTVFGEDADWIAATRERDALSVDDLGNRNPDHDDPFNGFDPEFSRAISDD